MISPRRPWPRGGAPIRARSSGLIPTVMNRSIRRPSRRCRAPRSAPDQVPNALDDQPEDGLDVEDLRDRARRRDERGEPLARLGHLRPRPGAFEGAPDEAGHCLAGVGRAIQPQHAERDLARGVDELAPDGAGRAHRSRAFRERSGTQAQPRQRRRLDRQVGTVRAGGREERSQRVVRLASPLRAGPVEQRVERFDQGGERKGLGGLLHVDRVAPGGTIGHPPRLPCAGRER